MARSKSTLEKDPKQQSKLIKNCCMFSQDCGKKEGEIHLCCSFCKNINCDTRCCDNHTKCKYLVCGDFYGEDEKELSKYNTIYKHREEDLQIIDEYRHPKKYKTKEDEEPPKEIKTPENVKRGPKPKNKEKIKEPIKNRSAKHQEKIKLEEGPQETKRGRGRPPKNNK